MTEATMTTGAVIKSEQGGIKSDTSKTALATDWNDSSDLGAFCALHGLTKKKASILACNLRKEGYSLKLFPRGRARKVEA